MKIALWVAAFLIVLALLAVGVGYSLPVKHTASREQVYRASPAALFAAITAPADYPRWRSGVRHVDVSSTQSGNIEFRETGDDGTITYAFEELDEPRRVVSRITDQSLPFGGKWTYELAPVTGGTRLRITEEGEVYNPIFRLLSRFVFGHYSGIDAFHVDLKRHVEKSPD